MGGGSSEDDNLRDTYYNGVALVVLGMVTGKMERIEQGKQQGGGAVMRVSGCGEEEQVLL